MHAYAHALHNNLNFKFRSILLENSQMKRKGPAVVVPKMHRCSSTSWFVLLLYNQVFSVPTLWHWDQRFFWMFLALNNSQDDRSGHAAGSQKSGLTACLI